LTIVDKNGLFAIHEEAPGKKLPCLRNAAEDCMAENILIGYASADGSTTGVAEVIGNTLSALGAVVDILPLERVTSLGCYQSVVLGSAVHGGKWLPEAVRFLQVHQAELCRVPTAFFLVGMMPASTNEKTRSIVGQFLEAERALVKPVVEGRFSGALYPNKYPFFQGLGMRFFLAYCGLGLHGGDYRDMDAVRAWSAESYPLLIRQAAELTH
jgi:menaquinone-dependent protoporphyrinogen oxidase